MLHLTGLPVISQTSRQCPCEPSPPLGGLEENCSAIGTALSLIKFRDHRSIKNIWEEQTLCRGMFGQAKASFLVSNPREQRICTIGEAFRVLKSRIFQASWREYLNKLMEGVFKQSQVKLARDTAK